MSRFCQSLLLVAAAIVTAPVLAEAPPPESPVPAGAAALQDLEHVTIFVREYEAALAWYVEKLGLIKTEDQKFGGTQRWLTVATSRDAPTRIVLAVPSESLTDSIGHQHNWVFRTGDCRATHALLSGRGVRFVQEPREAPWGCQAIIEDLYGNRIVLLGASARNGS